MHEFPVPKVVYSLYWWSFQMRLVRTPVWTRTWASRSSFRAKPFPHVSHSYGSSSVWIRMWRFRTSLFANILPHVSHLYGFSPVWTRLWYFRAPFRVNPLRTQFALLSRSFTRCCVLWNPQCVERPTAFSQADYDMNWLIIHFLWCLTLFTPKGDQCQIFPRTSLEILHHPP